jgi:hypothetical protein
MFLHAASGIPERHLPSAEIGHLAAEFPVDIVQNSFFEQSTTSLTVKAAVNVDLKPWIGMCGFNVLPVLGETGFFGRRRVRGMSDKKSDRFAHHTVPLTL